MSLASRNFGEAFIAYAALSGVTARRSRQAGASSRLLVCALILVSLPASPVIANVFEISRDGVVSVREGAGLATWEALSSETPASDQTGVKAAFPPNAITILQNVAVPQRFAALIQAAAASANISPALLAALVSQESGWNPQAVSTKGAMGLAQLMPATARDLGVNPRDPVANLTGGARYLRRLLDSFGGNVEMALAAYNAGPGRVRKANGVPAITETQAYVRSIFQRISSIDPEAR